MVTNLTCFKAYDIRGKIGEELNTEISYRIGRAFAQFTRANKVVIGADIRLTSESLKLALANGLMDGGSDVIDLGLCGTEHIYFATSYLGAEGGIAVTASHNPIDYNGMKLVRESSKAISGDTGLFDIKALAEQNEFTNVARKGRYATYDISQSYTEHLLTYINVKNLSLLHSKSVKPLKLVVNAGNGTAGPTIDALELALKQLNVPIEFIKVNHQPDGHFPNGIPNPLLVENRSVTQKAVIEHSADMGIAWDGDFDRCFFFDEQGHFIEGYYIVGLLAEYFLAKNNNRQVTSSPQKIIHDPRLTWNTIDIVAQAGGQAIQNKTGHAFIKERMRSEDAIYGGEMSAHHYFKDFFYCDSGMIPWLLIAELMCLRQEPLSNLVQARIKAYPTSGEINSRVADAQKAITRVFNFYQSDAQLIDNTDGISMEFSYWRFNLRSSNTEPVVRLNVESKGNIELMKEKVKEVLVLLRK
ncbi:phosphomannomutase CpsG [Colwellia sp. 1_MG-2023]|uniref:phosphomannomutase CpsG n=1 Tax=unclassified Colwellia TaxID=196834 RepID=UPI0026E3C15A|nr:MULTISPECIES: phosphomannomutase CpsG [unclassified Colwellia]MDO6652849.1 phosphomannomutase CpsG [Colwellia sp. 3_MG-2023]MDO6665851.1 phosphomannomutase CpsG [Colwellia sp. 2_MG-2023]MDO6690224.1 phosphomannomutase CpsG [Colwellia sp. 1_MG-2023]